MTTKYWVLAHLMESAQGMQHAKSARELTVGVEVEGFLLRAGVPADWDDAIAFFQAMERSGDWSFCEESECCSPNPLPFVRQRGGTDIAPVVKFDHPPHLLEITVGPEPNLIDLAIKIESCLRCVSETARQLQLEFSMQPSVSCAVPEADFEFYRGLRWTRRQCRERNGAPIDREAENYAARIAAFQLHVGGLDWATRPSWVEALYCWEPLLLWQGVGTHGPEEAATILKQRWNLYRDAFPGNPLIGFPDMQEWSVGHWANALVDTPLYGYPHEAFAGLSLRQTGIQIPWQEFKWRVRDLQILRPRHFGTIEFRADCAQRSVATLLRMAALRTGLCAALFERQGSPYSFAEARTIWWKIATTGQQLSDARPLEAAMIGLHARAFGEECLLTAGP